MSDTTIIPSLRPCPFCGKSNAYLYEHADAVACICPDCGAAGPQFGETPEGQFIEWSTRPLEDELTAALEEITDPIKFMRLRAEADGKILNGAMCVHMSESAEYLRGIAKSALAKARGEESK